MLLYVGVALAVSYLRPKQAPTAPPRGTFALPGTTVMALVIMRLSM